MGIFGFGVMRASLVCFLVIVVFFLASAAARRGIKEGHLITGKPIRGGTIRTHTAKHCQDICCKHDQCHYFRWRNGDHYGNKKWHNRCYLLKAKGKENIQHSFSWGPKCKGD